MAHLKNKAKIPKKKSTTAPIATTIPTTFEESKTKNLQIVLV